MLVYLSSRPGFKKKRPYIKNQAVNLHTKPIKLVQRIFKLFLACSFLLLNRVLAQELKTPMAGPLNLKPRYVSAADTFKKTMPFTTEGDNRRISRSLYMDHLGFLCKKEWQFERATGIPL